MAYKAEDQKAAVYEFLGQIVTNPKPVSEDNFEISASIRKEGEKTLKDILEGGEASLEASGSGQLKPMEINEFEFLQYMAEIENKLDYGSLFDYMNAQPVVMYDSSYQTQEREIGREEAGEMDEARVIEITKSIVISGMIKGYTQRDETTADTGISPFEKEKYALYKTLFQYTRMFVLNDLAERTMTA